MVTLCKRHRTLSFEPNESVAKKLTILDVICYRPTEVWFFPNLRSKRFNVCQRMTGHKDDGCYSPGRERDKIDANKHRYIGVKTSKRQGVQFTSHQPSVSVTHVMYTYIWKLSLYQCTITRAIRWYDDDYQDYFYDNYYYFAACNAP